MGDALAVALLEARGFTAEDFARSHPGGRLGKRLLVHVRDIMHTGTDIPQVSPDAALQQAILEMTRKKLGMTAITDASGKLLGIFTDGDLRRSFEKGQGLHEQAIAALMTAHFRSIDSQQTRRRSPQPDARTRHHRAASRAGRARYRYHPHA